MLAILSIVAPVFAIIAIGWAAGRVGYLSDDAARGIGEFAFSVSIPALLFKTIVTAKFGNVAPGEILLSFFGSAAVVWALSIIATKFVLRRPAEDGPSVAMCAVFGNTVMMGLPIGVASFGPEALAPLSVILGIHAPVFLFAATLHSAAVDHKEGQTLANALGGVAHSLIQQPIIVAIFMATVWRTLGVPVPAAILTMLDMLAGAGVPAALIALGLTLKTFQMKGDVATLAVMLVLKLLVLPALAAVLAFGVFKLPTVSAKMVVLTAALPAGANAYLFCLRSGRAVNSGSGAVAFGTFLSAVTVAGLLAIFHAVLD